jgi:hypothetical protein
MNPQSSLRDPGPDQTARGVSLGITGGPSAPEAKQGAKGRQKASRNSTPCGPPLKSGRNRLRDPSSTIGVNETKRLCVGCPAIGKFRATGFQTTMLMVRFRDYEECSRKPSSDMLLLGPRMRSRCTERASANCSSSGFMGYASEQAQG